MDRHYALPNPLSLQTELLTIGMRVQALCNFTIWIADPTWKEPGNATAASWTYAEQIGNLFWPLPTVQDPDAEDVEGAVSEEEYQRLKARNRQKGEHYTEQLRKHIIANRQVYNGISEVRCLG